MRMVALDTSLRSTGVALVAAGQVVAETWIGSGHSSAACLLPALEGLLKATGWSREMVEAIAVVTGPGSFTGLRIGVTTAKGLAYAWRVPVVGVTSLEVLAAEAAPLAVAWQRARPALAGRAGHPHLRPAPLIVPVVPSRRGECYLQVFTPPTPIPPLSAVEPEVSLAPAQQLPEPLGKPQVVSFSEWASGWWLPELPEVEESVPVILVGPGSLTGELIRLWERSSLWFYTAELAIHPGIVGRVASVRISRWSAQKDAGESPFRDAMEIMPLYLGRREGEPGWPLSQHPTLPPSR
ncbi:MAG: tRNA (adenosine(37)-N6)-threonylcarbamoyltransferase complex dimerization subunit type 1 TsaB [Limnochordales bacterium]|nr:tRNA (adenosine(37)-N6)-threonylcarbamoyltransferase complex dimerization subunit type 1 TsaB [Limnochordales bacterium]